MNREEKRAYDKKYYQEHKKEIRDQKRRYYQENKEEKKKYQREHKKEIKEYRKKYNQEHKEEAKEYKQKHKEEIREYNKNWYQKHKEETDKKHEKYRQKHKKEINEHQRKRHQENIKVRLSSNISTAIYLSLKENKNGRHWESLVSYTLEELINYLEFLFNDGMSWDNYGKWWIDHIVPIDSFNFSSYEDEEFKQCWALSNLQPLWWIDNIKKGNKNKKEYRRYLKEEK